MVKPALAPAQQAAVDRLAARNRVEMVISDPLRARTFLRAATDRVEQCDLLTSPVVRFGVAYDAAHDVGEAVLAFYGYRTTNRAGQHEALGRFLEAVFDSPPGQVAAQRFDRLRRARNQAHYEAAPVGVAEADLATLTASTLLDAALERLALE